MQQPVGDVVPNGVGPNNECESMLRTFLRAGTRFHAP